MPGLERNQRKILLYNIREQRQGNINKIEIGLVLDRKPKMANINPLEVENEELGLWRSWERA